MSWLPSARAITLLSRERFWWSPLVLWPSICWSTWPTRSSIPASTTLDTARRPIARTTPRRLSRRPHVYRRSARSQRMAIDAKLQATATAGPRGATAVPAPSRLAPPEGELVRAGRKSTGLWRDAGRRLLRDRAAVGGFAIVGVFVGIAFIPPAVVAPHPD